MAGQHREEALKALDQAIEKLAGEEPIEGLARFQLKGSLEYAREEVCRIQEVKRARKRKAAEP